jgi:hypothetical protein
LQLQITTVLIPPIKATGRLLLPVGSVLKLQPEGKGADMGTVFYLLLIPAIGIVVYVVVRLASAAYFQTRADFEKKQKDDQ